MNQSIPTAITQPTRRWLPRFSLRNLLVLVAVLGAGFGYLGHLLRRVTHQRHIVTKIHEARGRPTYNWQMGMGDHLDLIQHTDQVDLKIESLPGPDYLHRMTRVNRTGTTVQTEKLPGPWVLRKLLGNDVFAYVEEVDFDSYYPNRPFDPRLLLDLPKLKLVVLQDRQVSDEWLNVIAKIPELRGLALFANSPSRATATRGPMQSDGITPLSAKSNASATASGLALLKSAAYLEALTLEGDWFQDELFAGVAELRQLKQLRIISAPNLSSAIFSDVCQLTNLQVLYFNDCKHLDDAAAPSLAGLHNLRILHVIDASVADAILETIASLPDIEWLVLSKTPVEDRRMETIASVTKLKKLDLSHTKVGDAALDPISRLPNLYSLKLGDTKVTDAGLPALARMKQLESLELWPGEITDEGTIHLQTLTNLRELSIGPHISKAAADKLQAVLPQCKIQRLTKYGGPAAE
jgi:hypothetical protein